MISEQKISIACLHTQNVIKLKLNNSFNNELTFEIGFLVGININKNCTFSSALISILRI